MAMTIKLNELDESAISQRFPNGLTVTNGQETVTLYTLDDFKYLLYVTYGSRFYIARNEENATVEFCSRLRSHLKTFTPYIFSCYKAFSNDYANEYRTEFEKRYFKKGNEVEGNAQGQRDTTATNDPYTVTDTRAVTTDNDTNTFRNKEKVTKGLTQSQIHTVSQAVTDTRTRSFGIIDSDTNSHEVTDTQRQKFDPNYLNEVIAEMGLKFSDYASKTFMRFIDRWTYYCCAFGGELY